MSDETPKKADKRFRNKNEVAKEKRTKKNKEKMERLGLDGEPMDKAKMAKSIRRAKAERLKLGLKLLSEGRMSKDVAEECGVHANTVALWKKKYEVQIKAMIPEEQENADAFEAKLSKEAKAAVKQLKEEAHDQEQLDIAEMADSQASPQEQWQAYVASQGIRIMRDGMKSIRPPRTIKEFAELDSIVRRSMGLSNSINNSGKGGSGNSISIDVNILHNAKATKGGAESVVLDAEVTEEDSE